MAAASGLRFSWRPSFQMVTRMGLWVMAETRVKRTGRGGLGGMCGNCGGDYDRERERPSDLPELRGAQSPEGAGRAGGIAAGVRAVRWAAGGGSTERP